MGIFMSTITKPIKSFNIEARAQKVLKDPKILRPPVPASTVKQLKISKEIHPNFLDDHYKKNEQLYDRLKQIFVSSHDQQESNNKKSEKYLPSERSSTSDFEYGFWEPSDVPAGRCYLRTVLQFMSNHVTNSEKYTAEKIASEHKLDVKDVENILNYYRVYQIVKKGSDGMVGTPTENPLHKLENK